MKLLVVAVVLAQLTGTDAQAAIGADCSGGGGCAAGFCETQADASQLCKYAAGEACTGDGNCLINAVAGCTAPTACACDTGFTASDDNEMCLYAGGAACPTATIDCEDGYTCEDVSGTDMCVGEHGTDCTDDDDCMDGTTCEDGECYDPDHEENSSSFVSASMSVVLAALLSRML